MELVDKRETQETTTTITRKKRNKDRKEKGGTEDIVRGSELNDFVVH